MCVIGIVLDIWCGDESPKKIMIVRRKKVTTAAVMVVHLDLSILFRVEREGIRIDSRNTSTLVRSCVVKVLIAMTSTVCNHVANGQLRKQSGVFHHQYKSGTRIMQKHRPTSLGVVCLIRPSAFPLVAHRIYMQVICMISPPSCMVYFSSPLLVKAYMPRCNYATTRHTKLY